MSARDKKVERTGPPVSLGDIVEEYMGAPGFARMHAQGCQAHHPYGRCVAGCETDAELRERIQERFG